MASTIPTRIESHFALFKRGVYWPPSTAISEAHLHRYLAEFQISGPIRRGHDGRRNGPTQILTSAKGKRLLYRQPH